MRPTNVFVKTSDTIEQVASAVGAALGGELERIERDGELYFEAANSVETVSVFQNDYEDLPELPLSQYQFDVEIIGYYADKRRISRAREIFVSLKKTSRYSLLLADNAERRLDEYEPPYS